MGKYKRILCAIDLTDQSRDLCLQAAQLSASLDAHLTLLHVVEHFPEIRSNTIIAPEDVDPMEFREHRARERMGTLAHSCGCPDAGQQVGFSTGGMTDEVFRIAGNGDYDLVILGEFDSRGIFRAVPVGGKISGKDIAYDVLLVSCSGYGVRAGLGKSPGNVRGDLARGSG